MQEWAKEGRRLPPGYEEPPEVLPIAEFYWQAFHVLSSARQSGMGLGPIPFTAFVQFANVYGIRDVDDFEALRTIVSDIDAEFLKINQPAKDDSGGDKAVMNKIKQRAAAKFGKAD